MRCHNVALRAVLSGLPLLALTAMLTVPVIPGQARGAENIRALILDGQNNHHWKQSTPIMKWILEQSGRFTVDVSTSPPRMRKPRAPRGASKAERAEFDRKWREKSAELERENAAKWDAWRPRFGDYGVVVLNYNGQDWPEPVREAFISYVRGGGGG